MTEEEKWEGKMNKEIEKIKNRLAREYHIGWDTPIVDWRRALIDIKFLLSSLEKEKERAEKAEGQVVIKTLENAKGAQVLSNVEDELAEEKERANKHDIDMIFLRDQWEKEKERADEFQGKYVDLGGVNQHLRMDIFELKERMKELEGELRVSSPYVQEIVKSLHQAELSLKELVEEHQTWARILGHIIVAHLQGSHEALDVYKYMKIIYLNGEPLVESKILEELKANPIKFENVKWDHNSDVEIVDSLDFLNDEGEDIYTDQDGKKIEEVKGEK